MARRKSNRNKMRTYARPVTTGNQTMSFDLSQAYFNASLGDGVVLTPNKIRALLGLNADTVDAIKITSIVFAPWVESGISILTGSTNPPTYYLERGWSADFADGQRFTVMDKSKPTKVVPSKLSPAGRWSDAGSTSIQLVTIKGPYQTVGSSNFKFLGSVVVNVAVRFDKVTTTALAPA